MDKDIEARLLTVLEDIREGQRQQLAKQGEALELQRANFDLVKEQLERANKIQDRAENLQHAGTQFVAAARKSALIVVPIIVLLLLSVAWLIFRLL